MKKTGRQIHLQGALASLVGRLDRRGRGAYQAARVAHAWNRVSTGIAATHTAGAHLRDGTLHVYVDGNSWAALLSASAEQYRRAVNEELGEELVKALRFTVSRGEFAAARVSEPAEDEEEPNESPSVPLTEVEKAQIEASVAKIPDEELREAVFRATVRNLERGKADKERGQGEGSCGPSQLP